MVRASVLAVLALGIAATTTGAQEKAKAPTGPPPEFVTVVAMDKAEGVLALEYCCRKNSRHPTFLGYLCRQGNHRFVWFCDTKQAS